MATPQVESSPLPRLVGVTQIAIAIVLLAGCEADVGPEPVPTEWDAEIPDEPRPSEELPGAEVEVGEDPCGTDASCHWDARGVDRDAPFSESAVMGAYLDDRGAVTLDSTTTHRHFAWIPNAGDDTVALIDTEERAQVGRFRTGPTHAEMGPSRTAIDRRGAVYVANALHRSVTKIALMPDCRAEGEGSAPQTSTGPDQVYDWGDDDCVEWHQRLDGYGDVESVAVQETDQGSYLWVGARDESLWKLDAETGTPLFRTEAPLRPNAMVVDSHDHLWITGHYEPAIGRVDLTRCRDSQSCEVTICEEIDDDCVKSRVEAPAMAYGISLDEQDRPWFGGSLMRFDPSENAGQRWHQAGVDMTLHGVVADGDRWVFAAAGASGVYRFLADSPDQYELIAGTAGRSASAVSIDSFGYLWAANPDHNELVVITPGTGMFDGEIDGQLAGFDEPRPFTDFLGDVVQFDANQVGQLREVFHACDPEEVYHTEWQTLRLDVETPGGSHVLWRARAASRTEELSAATWIEVGTSPDLGTDFDLRAVLAERDMARAAAVEVEARLYPSATEQRLDVPRVVGVEVIAECPPIVL